MIELRWVNVRDVPIGVDTVYVTGYADAEPEPYVLQYREWPKGYRPGEQAVAPNWKTVTVV